MINRFLGAVNTSVNPEFMFVNLLRDIQTAAITLSTEESGEMAADVVLGVPGAIKAAYQFKTGVKNADTALFKDFMLQGGKIGYREFTSFRMPRYPQARWKKHSATARTASDKEATATSWNW